MPLPSVSLASKASLPFKKGEIVTVQELDERVYLLQKIALDLGMIPIASIISEEVEKGRHKILGGGFNHLKAGIPGIHGETGAIIDMGRVEGGYQNLVGTSSLSPCPFCQSCMARHLGIKKIRILDDKNYVPEKDGYSKVGITPEIAPHIGIEEIFGKWVRDLKNTVIWKRDIGIATGDLRPPREFGSARDWSDHIQLAHQLALDAFEAGEAPIGAVVVDDLGQVAGSGYAKIKTENDPSNTAAMCAWRECGSRDGWGSYTLVLTAGPDHIASGMFNPFGFGQLVVASDLNFAGQIDAIRSMKRQLDGRNVPVHVLNDKTSDRLLYPWMRDTDIRVVREYLGADLIR